MKEEITFRELQWDTEFFGVHCAKAILHKPLEQTEWDSLKERFENYQFVSIENRNSEPSNAQLIGMATTAFLADVNVQFIKKLQADCDMPESVVIVQAMDRNEKLLKIAEFSFSKFTEDPELAKRKGAEVYQQWLINSFGKQNKYFVVSEDAEGEINGFLLHSYSDEICTVELIAVSSNATKSGIGTRMFKALECEAYKRGCDEIHVGTQARNLRAVNFYNKVGCRQFECNQVYHLWNLESLRGSNGAIE